MSGPFVTAVKAAISQDSDCWEALYYKGSVIDKKTGRSEWSPRRQPVYMETRKSALGPDWAEWRTTILRIKHEVRYA